MSILTGRSFLVVEDEMLVLMNIEMMLLDLGCEKVSCAATVSEALALIREQTFDGALLDINLNGEESYPIAVALRKTDTPFLFSTGYNAGGMKEGFSDCLVLRKPYQSSGLTNAIGLLMEDKLAVE